MYQLTDKAIARFHSKVHRNSTHWGLRAPNETPWQKYRGCWLWFGALTEKNRYGKFALRDESNKRVWVLAHRLSWHVYRGIIVPDNVRLTNECGIPYCINPEHWHSSHDALALALRYSPKNDQPDRDPEQLISDEVDEALEEIQDELLDE